MQLTYLEEPANQELHYKKFFIFIISINNCIVEYIYYENIDSQKYKTSNIVIYFLYGIMS